MQERRWLDSAGSSVQVQKQNVLLFRSKKMSCFPQDADSGQCFNLQSKLWMQLQCCSKHWHKAELSTVLSQGRHKVGSGTELQKLFLNLLPCVSISMSYCWSPSLATLWAAAPCVPYWEFLCKNWALTQNACYRANTQSQLNTTPCEKGTIHDCQGTQSWNLWGLKPLSMRVNRPCLLQKPTLMELITIPLPLS